MWVRVVAPQSMGVVLIGTLSLDLLSNDLKGGTAVPEPSCYVQRGLPERAIEREWCARYQAVAILGTIPVGLLGEELLRSNQDMPVCLVDVLGQDSLIPGKRRGEGLRARVPPLQHREEKKQGENPKKDCNEIQQRSREKGPAPALFIVLNLLIGLSCAFPAYLYAREHKS